MSETQAPCPTCGSGKQIINNYKKKEAELFDTAWARVPFVPRSPLTKVDITPKIIDASAAFKGGKCPDCGGKKTVPDKSDLTKNIKAATEEAHKYKDTMHQHEKALGPPGGNRTTIIAGNETIQVGLQVNKAKSYNVVNDGTHVPSKVHIGEKNAIAGSSKSNYVHGTNPLSSPGGNYTLTVSNKMTVVVGAQGLDINTYGPINIAGGITSITGPQITIGSSTGQVSLEGKHLQITGDTIAMVPTGGSNQVMVQGSLGVQANMVCAGGAHIDGDLSFTSASCPSKVSRTKFSSSADKSSDKAVWFTNGSAMQAGKDISRTVSLFQTDPSLIMTTPRGQTLLMDKMKTCAYASAGLESVITALILPGDCNVVGTGNLGYPVYSTNPAPIPVYNYVHVHQLHDGAHTHEFEGPNIKLTEDDVACRSLNSGKQDGNPIPAGSEQIQPSFVPAGTIGSIAGR